MKERELRQKIIGRFLKTGREKVGLTQLQVANEMGYSSAQFVSNWERGLSLPPLDLLPRLAVLFKVSPRIFVENIHRYQDELLKLQKREIAAIFRDKSPKAM